jgi:PKD repeat protein
LTIRLDATQTVIPEKTITGFEWEFDDQSPSEFGAARTEHTYEKSGTYSVQLSVRTTDGKEYVTSRTIVVQPPILRACILPSRTSGKAPLGIKFATGCSVGDPSSVLWDFGDGSQTDEAEPIHVFEEPGDYTVTLTFTDAEDNEQSAQVDISATQP